MKKITAFLLAMLMLFSLAAAAEEDDSVSIEDVYDTSSLESLIDSMTDDYEAVLEALEEALDELFEATNESYDGYVENRESVTAWYELTVTETEALFERVAAGCVTYFKMIDATDWDEIDDALEDYYEDIYDDLISEYYDDLYDDLYDDIYDEYLTGCLEDQPDDVEYVDWENTFDEAYNEWYDYSEEIYRMIEDFQTELYYNYSRIQNGFSGGNTDVDAILNREYLGETMLSILETIESETEAAMAELTAALPAKDELSVETEDDYVDSMNALSEWYALAEETIAALYDTIEDYALEYYTAIADEIEDADTYSLYGAFEEIYWTVYNETYYDIYYAVYTDAFDQIYNYYIWDALYYNNISDWDAYDAWEASYDEWSEAQDEIYDLLDEYDETFYDTWDTVRYYYIYEEIYDLDAILSVEVDEDEEDSI